MGLSPNNEHFLYLHQISSPVRIRSLYAKECVFLLQFLIVPHLFSSVFSSSSPLFLKPDSMNWAQKSSTESQTHTKVEQLA